MNLVDYIGELGAPEFAKRFGVSRRTAESYRQRRRVPRPDVAQAIIAKSPVTWEGIYSPKGERPKAGRSRGRS